MLELELQDKIANELRGQGWQGWGSWRSRSSWRGNRSRSQQLARRSQGEVLWGQWSASRHEQEVIQVGGGKAPHTVGLHSRSKLQGPHTRTYSLPVLVVFAKC